MIDPCHPIHHARRAWRVWRVAGTATVATAAAGCGAAVVAGFTWNVPANLPFVGPVQYPAVEVPEPSAVVLLLPMLVLAVLLRRVRR